MGCRVNFLSGHIAGLHRADNVVVHIFKHVDRNVEPLALAPITDRRVSPLHRVARSELVECFGKHRVFDQFGRLAAAIHLLAELALVIH